MTSPQPPDQLTIRSGESADLPDIHQLLLTLGYPVPLHTLEYNLSLFAKRQDVCLQVATYGPRTVGVIMATVSRSLTTGEIVTITNLVVNESYRRQGIARHLVQEAIRWTTGLGLQVIRVGSQTHREDAHAFYQALGFEYVKTQHWFVLRNN